MVDPKQSAAQLLRAGYGVEDIALAKKLALADLRAAIVWMRRTGQLRRALGLPVISQTPGAGHAAPTFPKDI